MRPILPIAAAVLLAAGAVSIPALTQAAQAQTKHHTWKKANIDTTAMSASMSAANPSAFQPSTGDQQPGAINANTPAGTMGGGMSSDTNANTAPSATMGGGMSSDATAGAQTAPAGQDAAMQPMSGKDDSATTSAKSKKMKHGKHAKAATDDSSNTTTAPATSTTDQQPGAIDPSGSSNAAQSPAMQGNSATMGTSTSPTASPDDTMTQPDASKAATTPPATDSSNTPAK